MDYKLFRIQKSDRRGKRLMAVFKNGKRTRITHFGQSGASTYIDHKDKKKRDNYRARHKKDLDTNDPLRAGYLSYYLLWGDSTNLKTNVQKYKRTFNL